MCGIVGYIGKSYSRNYVIEGLTRLEYRGYDSAGFACLNPDDNRLVYARSVGQLTNLVKKMEAHPIDGNIGIGHTRWSTHGVSSQENAHPQFDCKKTLSIIHNGIIENHHELRKQLQAVGHVFDSETDTEIIAHMLESLLTSHTTLKSAVIELIATLEGAYAFISILQEYPDTMLLVRKRSPLCVGIGDDEMFVASDLLAFMGKTKQVLFMPDQSFALIRKDFIELYDFTGKPLPIHLQEISIDFTAHEKKGHEHFMLKEIYEQKMAIHSTVDFLKSISANIWHHIGLSSEQVKNLNSISLVGCGTSWHAGRIAQFFFEQICMMPTRSLLASEFRYMSFFPDTHGVYIAISQSGETADTLEALRLITSMQLPTVALTNVASSTMVREADGFLLTQAGQEIAVASTKAFSTQVAALFWLANRMALEKGIITQSQMKLAEEDILVAAQVLEDCIENYKMEIMQTHARKYAQYKRSIFLGRHISYPFAMEAALKLKEIAYIFAQCYPAGELKHGPLALVDADTPVFLFSHRDPLIYQKLLSNAQEVKARNGHLIIFAFEGQTELCELADLLFIIPNVHPLLGPLAMTGLMQFFVYQIALQLGCAIDKPRNLAKSVTVE
ncbi:MAG: glutamine--fructose-6-phosphate transaminase (isomerizing) [Candidatus Babeliales bacterium]|nr:glutamine--fructose-6-phosphate transaminase (isomerizing) [Candidatus Babeliales bacterium]